MNHCRYRLYLRLGFFLVALSFKGQLSAGDFLTREEAMAAAFPGAQIQSEMLFLTEAQQKEAAALAGAEMHTSMIARYTAVRDGRVLGKAYVDTHLIHIKKETLLIILDEDGILRRIEILGFLEDPEHMAPRAFYGQYEGKSLSNDLYIDRAIRPVAGATLTARATNEAVRRILAIDRVVRGKTKETP